MTVSAQNAAQSTLLLAAEEEKAMDSEPNADEIPERHNGVKTQYELFDGYRELNNNALRLMYLLGAVLTIFTFAPVIPIIFEFMQFTASKTAETQARDEIYEVANHKQMHPRDDADRAPDIHREHGHENPERHYTKDMASVGQREVATERSMTIEASFLDALIAKREAEARAAEGADAGHNR